MNLATPSDKGLREVGFWHAMVSIPQWPLAEAIPIHFDTGGGTIDVRILIDGRVTAHVCDANGVTLALGQSQPIVVTASGRILVGAAWSDGRATIRVCGRNAEGFEQELKSFAECQSAMPVDPMREGLGTTASYEDPESRTRCAAMMTSRQIKYGVARAQTGRRSVTLEEDATRLANAIKGLGAHVDAVLAGEGEFVRDIRAALRDLVVEKRSSSQSKALLMRIAGRIGAPLPVFAVEPPSVSQQGIGPELAAFFAAQTVHYTTPKLSIVRVLPRHALIDLEECLAWRCYENVIVDVSDAETPSRAVASAAETLGGSHSDPGIPYGIDTLESSHIGKLTLATHLLIEVARVTIDLGHYVLREAGAVAGSAR